MAKSDVEPRHALSRRDLLGLPAMLSFFGSLAVPAMGSAGGTLRFGLTPVFLTSDIELLAKLRNYLSRQTGREVQLVQRRTYEEITSLRPWSRHSPATAATAALPW